MDALRRARDIWAYVREVKDLCTQGAWAVAPDTLWEWDPWALAQADRIDAAVSGRFCESMEEPAE